MSNQLTFDAFRFYRTLIKSPLSLHQRNSIGELLSKYSRNSNPQTWSRLLSNAEKFQSVLSILRQLGYMSVDLPYATELALQLRQLPCKGRGTIGSGGRTETDNLENVSSLPLVQKLSQDPSLYQLVSLYLNAPAFLHTIQAWWQYPMGADHIPSNAQLWHRDRDDLSEIKLFFYATDVDQSAGPHSFIPCSHTYEGLKTLFSPPFLENDTINGVENNFIDDEFFSEYDIKSIQKTWIGSAGTCFLEDTRGFHRAYVPVSKPRLILSLVWTVGPGF